MTVAKAVNSNVEGTPLALVELPTGPWRNGFLSPEGTPATRRPDEKENTDAPA